MRIFTIGYGGRRPDDLIQWLVHVEVRTVVDVRLRPDRAAMGIYAKAKTSEKGIENLLSQARIDYRSLPELGNIFLDCGDWDIRYSALLERAGDLLITRLMNLAEPLCLLCAERKVRDCHRLQIAKFLQTQGHEIEHLDGD